MRILIVASLALALAVGCAGDTGLGIRQGPGRAERTVDPGAAFEIRVGETVLVAGTHVLIFFDRVLEDSRCPTGVECPWEGNAGARFELSLDNAELAPQPVVLNTTLAPREAGRFDLRFRITTLRPYPDYSGPPIDPADYVAELEISRP
ncbi:MAG: hypothetical protein ACREMK_05815 [Gemmatimonadota bacterium]